MKLFVRILTLLLCAFLCFSVFTSCKNNEDETPGYDYEDEEYEDEEDEYFPDVEKNSYDEDFMIYVLPDSNPVDFYVLEESDGSPMDEAVFARQERVNKYLGIDIILTQSPTGTNFSNYHEIVKSAVNNKDATVDTCITHVNFGVNSLISEGYLKDLSDVDGLDLEADYWNIEFMESLELNGRIYLGYSDYNIMYTNVVVFNKEMMDQYKDSIPKSVYDLVLDYEWTIDEMIRLSSLVSQDMTGDGKTMDDKYGFAGSVWVSFCGMLQACDINMMEMDDSGTYKMAINSAINYPKTENLISKIKEWAKTNYAYISFPANTKAPSFTSGNILLSIGSTNNLNNYLEYDMEFGVLPYPMYDTNQANVGYRSLQWGGYITLPIYLRNEAKVCEALELLAYYSENVKITFYEKLLGKQVADMPEDAAMLDIVWESVCTDVGQTFANTAGDSTGVCYTITQVADPNSSFGGLASFIASKEYAVNNGFKKFIDGLK